MGKALNAKWTFFCNVMKLNVSMSGMREKNIKVTAAKQIQITASKITNSKDSGLTRKNLSPTTRARNESDDYVKLQI